METGVEVALETMDEDHLESSPMIMLNFKWEGVATLSIRNISG